MVLARNLNVSFFRSRIDERVSRWVSGMVGGGVGSWFRWMRCLN